jgi:hypothetical protein
VVDSRSENQPRRHQGVHVPQFTFGYVFGEVRLEALHDRQEPFPNCGKGNFASLQGRVHDNPLKFGRAEVGVNKGFDDGGNELGRGTTALRQPVNLFANSESGDQVIDRGSMQSLFAVEGAE